MARNATIHRARLELSLVDRDVYAEPTITVARHPSETLERMVLRLLAFALRYEQGLEFGRGVSTTDEPDLWSHRAEGGIAQWVEVGQPDPQRLVKAARRAERVTLLAWGAGVERWREASLPSLESIENLGIACVADDLVRGLAERAERQIRWSLTLSGGVLFVSNGESAFESTPEVWLGEPLG